MFQRLLPLSMRADYSLSKWVMAPCNEVAARWILCRQTDPFMACLCGESQAGKTHLGHIFAQLWGGALLSPSDKLSQSPSSSARAILDRFPSAQAFVLDPFDLWPEPWLFDAFNLLKERHLPTLWITSRPPQTRTFVLPDWESRLKSLPLLTVGLPDDALRKRILLKRLEDFGTRVDPDAVDELLNRIPRTWEALRHWTIRLDQMSSLLKRRISRGLIRDLLRENEAEEDLPGKTEKATR